MVMDMDSRDRWRKKIGRRIKRMNDGDLSAGGIGRKQGGVIMSRWISQMDGGDWFTGGIG